MLWLFRLFRVFGAGLWGTGEVFVSQLVQLKISLPLGIGWNLVREKEREDEEEEEREGTGSRQLLSCQDGSAVELGAIVLLEMCE